MYPIWAIALVAFNLNGPFATQPVAVRDSVADVQAAQTLLTNFEHAWHAADGAKLGNLFTGDGDLVIPTGELMHGQAKIAGFYNSVFDRGYRGSTTTARIAQVRHVSRDIIIADATWEISGAVTTAGAAKPPERGILVVVLKRVDKQWRVAALREQSSATRVAVM